MKASELIQALARRIHIGGDTPVKVKVGEELFELSDDLHFGQVDESGVRPGINVRMVCVLPLADAGAVVKHPWCQSCKCEPFVLHGTCRGCGIPVEWK